MKQLLRHVFEQRGTLSFQDVLLHIVAAALLSIVIYMSYAYTHTGTAYSKKFNVSLMTLTVLNSNRHDSYRK
ncbi:membrane protein [Streptococcus equi subsp. equi]|nr:membrane protein [Streptococcus equi subsp. equi]CRU08724.1 membrane protein [Streptococcus equi subsp. equi]CRU12538.1 membrane protein [Streptococcus equi subsp. equi]CRU54586.1 membrane protein [Streptococcus equi subsp. equi]CRW40916.1 membrane protein [Streptococcus equi subsp. equi]